jgi:hypothetical protein
LEWLIRGLSLTFCICLTVSIFLSPKAVASVTIKVLENVQDFMQEGDILQHCIFTNEYFKRKNSLLFSAHIDNTPVETIEVSLSKMEITQCRGMKNKFSKHHKIILSLMKKNLFQIRSRMKKDKAIKS